MVLHGEIDVEASKVSVMPRNVFMIIQKKESSEGFWPRLMGKGTGKGATFIKTDWSKWVVSGGLGRMGCYAPCV